MRLWAKLQAQISRLVTARYHRLMARIYETSLSGNRLFTVLCRDTLDRNPTLRAVVNNPDDDAACDALVAETLYLCRYPTFKARLGAYGNRAFYSAFYRFEWYLRLCEKNWKLQKSCLPSSMDEKALRGHGYWAQRGHDGVLYQSMTHRNKWEDAPK